MTQLIYLVSSGDYSDYSIVAVYLTKEDADLHAATFQDCHVEERGISEIPPQVREGLRFYYVSVRKQLDVEPLTVSYISHQNSASDEHCEASQWKDATVYTCYLWASDEKDAGAKAIQKVKDKFNP